MNCSAAKEGRVTETANMHNKFGHAVLERCVHTDRYTHTDGHTHHNNL